MADPVETDVERRLNQMMVQHPVEHSRRLMLRIKALVNTMQAEGVHPELLAFVVAQHAAGLVAAMKMAPQIRPEFADALGEDFAQTINRALSGQTNLMSKQ